MSDVKLKIQYIIQEYFELSQMWLQNYKSLWLCCVAQMFCGFMAFLYAHNFSFSKMYNSEKNNFENQTFSKQWHLIKSSNRIKEKNFLIYYSKIENL